jgi:hypothetical protein
MSLRLTLQHEHHGWASGEGQEARGEAPPTSRLGPLAPRLLS